VNRRSYRNLGSLLCTHEICSGFWRRAVLVLVAAAQKVVAVL
jgi:hypothetical protein